MMLNQPQATVREAVLDVFTAWNVEVWESKPDYIRGALKAKGFGPGGPFDSIAVWFDRVDATRTKVYVWVLGKLMVNESTVLESVRRASETRARK